MTIESKSVVAQMPTQQLYTFLSDFNNFSHLVPQDKVQNYSCTTDRCSFSVGGFMQLTLAYVERIPFSRVVVAPAADASSPIPFRLIIDLKPEDALSTRVHVMFDMEGGNPMMNMMLKPKLQEAANKLAEGFANMR